MVGGDDDHLQTMVDDYYANQSTSSDDDYDGLGASASKPRRSGQEIPNSSASKTTKNNKKKKKKGKPRKQIRTSTTQYNQHNQMKMVIQDILKSLDGKQTATISDMEVYRVYCLCKGNVLEAVKWFKDPGNLQCLRMVTLKYMVEEDLGKESDIYSDSDYEWALESASKYMLEELKNNNLDDDCSVTHLAIQLLPQISKYYALKEQFPNVSDVEIQKATEYDYPTACATLSELTSKKSNDEEDYYTTATSTELLQQLQKCVGHYPRRPSNSKGVEVRQEWKKCCHQLLLDLMEMNAIFDPISQYLKYFDEEKFSMNTAGAFIYLVLQILNTGEIKIEKAGRTGNGINRSQAYLGKRVVALSRLDSLKREIDEFLTRQVTEAADRFSFGPDEFPSTVTEALEIDGLCFPLQLILHSLRSDVEGTKFGGGALVISVMITVASIMLETGAQQHCGLDGRKSSMNEELGLDTKAYRNSETLVKKVANEMFPNVFTPEEQQKLQTLNEAGTPIRVTEQSSWPPRLPKEHLFVTPLLNESIIRSNDWKDSFKNPPTGEDPYDGSTYTRQDKLDACCVIDDTTTSIETEGGLLNFDNNKLALKEIDENADTFFQGRDWKLKHQVLGLSAHCKSTEEKICKSLVHRPICLMFFSKITQPSASRFLQMKTRAIEGEILRQLNLLATTGRMDFESLTSPLFAHFVFEHLLKAVKLPIKVCVLFAKNLLAGPDVHGFDKKYHQLLKGSTLISHNNRKKAVATTATQVVQDSTIFYEASSVLIKATNKKELAKQAAAAVALLRDDQSTGNAYHRLDRLKQDYISGEVREAVQEAEDYAKHNGGNTENTRQPLPAETVQANVNLQTLLQQQQEEDTFMWVRTGKLEDGRSALDNKHRGEPVTNSKGTRKFGASKQDILFLKNPPHIYTDIVFSTLRQRFSNNLKTAKGTTGAAKADRHPEHTITIIKSTAFHCPDQGYQDNYQLVQIKKIKKKGKSKKTN